MSYSTFVTKKIDVALTLSAGGCGGGYTEAAIILAALSSGIAADIWPGEGIDRKRFVELWARYSDQQLGSLKISVPLFVQHLRKTGNVADALKLEAARPEMFGPGHSTRILIGPEVDMTENEILQLGLGVSLQAMRAFSYPALFYKHVRCGLMHEFHLTEEATWNPMTTRAAGISYSNRGDTAAPFATKRLIHFEVGWLANVLRSIVSHFGNDGPATATAPAVWWIEGG